MKISTLKTRATSVLLTLAIVACYSMVTVAGESKLSGEIVVSGKSDSVVTVNGESIKSGRTIFSSSTIVTPADASAFVSVKNVGKLKIAPNTKMVVSFDAKGISGSIDKGKMTVVESVDIVSMTAPNGKVALLNSGDTVSTVQDDDDGVSGGEALIPVLILAGLVAIAAIYIATSGDDNQGAFVSGTN